MTKTFLKLMLNFMVGRYLGNWLNILENLVDLLRQVFSQRAFESNWIYRGFPCVYILYLLGLYLYYLGGFFLRSFAHPFFVRVAPCVQRGHTQMTSSTWGEGGLPKGDVTPYVYLLIKWWQGGGRGQKSQKIDDIIYGRHLTKDQKYYLWIHIKLLY